MKYMYVEIVETAAAAELVVWGDEVYYPDMKVCVCLHYIGKKRPQSIRSLTLFLGAPLQINSIADRR